MAESDTEEVLMAAQGSKITPTMGAVCWHLRQTQIQMAKAIEILTTIGDDDEW